MTVKVRGDAGPTFPETGLEIGVEVGYSDDVAVTARVVSLRLREQTFIPVVEMDVGIQVVLYRPSCGARSPPEHRHHQRLLKSLVKSRISRFDKPEGCDNFWHTSIDKLNTKISVLPKVIHPIISWHHCLHRP